MVTDVGSAELIRRVKRGSDLDDEAASELARRVASGDTRTLRLLTTVHRRHPHHCDLAARAMAISDTSTATPLRQMVMALSQNMVVVREILAKIYQCQLVKLGVSAEELSDNAMGMARDALAGLQWRPDSEYANDLAQQSLSIFLSRLVLRPLPTSWRGTLASIIYRTEKGRRFKDHRQRRILKDRFAPYQRALARMVEHEDLMLFVNAMVLKYEAVLSPLPAWDRLTDDQREVVLLRIHQGHTFAAIAEVVGASESTVLRRYTAAMEKLRQVPAD